MTSTNVTHHKTGGEYFIIGIALDTSTKQPVVVYQQSGETTMFTRPIAEFFGVESIPDSDGKNPFRFTGAIAIINDLLAPTWREVVE